MRDYRKKVSAKEPEYKAYVCNRYASGGKNACSSHYINQKVLTQIVMTDIRCKAMWAQNSRETLRAQLLAREQSASVERTRTLHAELNAIGKRLPELDKLIQSAYEDKVLGRIPESVCVNLLNQYEAERREKQERHKELTEQLAASRALVDFTQGLDIRLTNPDNIALLNRVRTKAVHFAWDNPEEDLTEHFKRFVAHTAIRSDRNRRVYVLTNYGSTHEQDLYRVNTLRALGYDPYVMIYERPTAPKVTRHLQRWVNNKRIFHTVKDFKDYAPMKKEVH